MTSEKETLEHKQMVSHYMNLIIRDLIYRAEHHDDSKLGPDEVPYFDEHTETIKDITYNSAKDHETLAKLKPALDHHYTNNRHHPQHFPNGIRDMNLVDVVEMLCDWKASSLRHRDGNILKSLTENQKKFDYSTELEQILENTVQLFE
jgi:hypothetical protein